ncbi:MAG: hypothetical protein QOH33_2098, partial [Paraburkholderia sp.]|nr:hypothetical protein [Paraburkholderia sp.]
EPCPRPNGTVRAPVLRRGGTGNAVTPRQVMVSICSPAMASLTGRVMDGPEQMQR